MKYPNVMKKLIKESVDNFNYDCNFFKEMDNIIETNQKYNNFTKKIQIIK